MTLLDLRALPTAMFGSAVAHGRAYRSWDAAIRRPLATSRRIGFLSLMRDVGTSTLATQVTRITAARRAEPVLAVDVSGVGSGLGELLGAGPTRPSDVRAAARTTEDARHGLEGHDGWFALRPATTDGPVAAWLEEAAPITRFFDVTVTDFGSRPLDGDLASCAALCDVVCIVSDAARAPAEYARALAPAIARLPEHPAPVIALVDRTDSGLAAAQTMAADPFPVVGVPFDRRAAGADRDAALGARHALLRLTAALVSGGGEAV